MQRLAWVGVGASLEDRFWAKVDRRGPDECWLWLGTKRPGGGSLALDPKVKSVRVLAHRYVYEQVNGPIATEAPIAHKCGAVLCVNPAHLYVGKKGRAPRTLVPLTFLQTIKKRPDGCWVWPQKRTEWSEGGTVSVPRQIAYEQHAGALDTDDVLLRLCGSKMCIRPEHMERRSMSQAARFERLVQKSDDDGCWGWNGPVTGKGYGWLQKRPGAPGVLAHRLSYQLHKGAIPVGLFVMHSCDNPPCSNPAHLSVGTAADNRRDMLEKGRGHWQQGAPPREPGQPWNRKRALTEYMGRHVIETGPDDCWLWRGRVDDEGRGQVRISLDNRAVQLAAHRVSYELAYGHIAPGLCVCRRCNQSACVNPRHLFIATPDEAARHRTRILEGGAVCGTLTHTPRVGACGLPTVQVASPCR